MHFFVALNRTYHRDMHKSCVLAARDHSIHWTGATVSWQKASYSAVYEQYDPIAGHVLMGNKNSMLANQVWQQFKCTKINKGVETMLK